jgi:hypothetical protein
LRPVLQLGHAPHDPGRFRRRERLGVGTQAVVAALQGRARVVAFLMAGGEKGRGVQGHVLAELVAGLDLGARPQRPAMARVDREKGLGDERLVVVVVIVHRGRETTPARRGWYNLGLPRHHRSTAMSADRDRGIRRIKQKRAKAQTALAVVFAGALPPRAPSSGRRG